MALKLLPLMDDQKCFQTVRERRWPAGVRGPHCDSTQVTKRGFDDTQQERQRDRCGGREREFSEIDLTGTVFAGHHQPLRVWVLCLDFRGLNLSNSQIAQEWGLDPDSVPDMTTPLRNGLLAKQPVVVLSGEVECDEVYVVAGHKGHPEAVKQQAEGMSSAMER